MGRLKLEDPFQVWGMGSQDYWPFFGSGMYRVSSVCFAKLRGP